MSLFAGESRDYPYEQLREGPHRVILREFEDPALVAELCASLTP